MTKSLYNANKQIKARDILQNPVARFKRLDLDVHILYTNAYNGVERRMTPLGKHWSGLILPRDYIGFHLDANRKTIDEELEKEHFKKAGEILAEVWSNSIIDTYTAHAEFVQNAKVEVEYPDEDWVSRHVTQSQYVLQIVRCKDVTRCARWRSNWTDVAHFRFLAWIIE